MLRQVQSIRVFKRHLVYVPKHKPPNRKDFDSLKKFIDRHDKILILTGAGISTESGKYIMLYICLTRSEN